MARVHVPVKAQRRIGRKKIGKGRIEELGAHNSLEKAVLAAKTWIEANYLGWS